METVRKLFNKSSLLVPLVSIVLGLLCGAIAMLIGGYDPILAYSSLVEKLLGSAYDFGETIRAVTPLIFTGLAIAFAFRTGLFNIGAEGQFIMGMTGATIVGVSLELPWYIHGPLAVAAGAVFGGLWAAIAGYLKAARGVNEVISSIMLNWIALFLSNYIVAAFLLEEGQQKSRPIHDSARMSINWLADAMDHARVHWGALIAIICVVIFYLLLWRTKQGFELRAVGHNPNAALYAGMNVSRTIVKSMFISGVFAGLGGAFEVLGVFGYQVVMAGMPGYGFEGIAVALLGGNTPVGVFLGAVLFGGLSYGAAGMSFGADVPTEIVRIVIGTIIFFVASHGLVLYILKPFLNRRKAAAKEKEAAKA
ncbi:ABC transporter permease [Paenibacillus sp. NEAU-GSW1]|uniref:ABC transporter permease n=1 Tax=Paenibacillus sp. NEAU-GSW1 TaxID=2682486 RepID=UPI0012E15BAB|nr:ABC transporter permease [Paenibacillus sp. NEAU-GSW1]MUT67676.1 ABC transporter permease [Paenibacillus sp. NEAU-GSW1]